MPPPRPWIHIESGPLSAQIDPQGAQLSRLTAGGTEELLWNGDPSVWAGRAPLLFPIVGVLSGGSYRIGADTYRLSRHGFARDREFTVLESTASMARLGLSADEDTRKIYPFEFKLEVEFRIRAAALETTSSVTNMGDGDLFASFGYHPALCWPLPFGQQRSSHFIEFEASEPAPVRRIDAQGLLRPEAQTTPVKDRRLYLKDSLFTDDVLIFDRLNSKSLIYGCDSGTRLRVDFPDARYLGIWTKPGANFICIEPWHGITDPKGYDGDFTQKPGIFKIPRGQTFRSAMAITLQDR